MAFTTLPDIYKAALLQSYAPPSPPASTGTNDPGAMAAMVLQNPGGGATNPTSPTYPVGAPNFGAQYGAGYPSGPGTPWGPRYSIGNPGPDDAWMAANPGPWQGTGLPNTGIQDKWGNTYLPVVAGAWGGKWVDPATFPQNLQGSPNAQLWGGVTSDDAPDWLKKITMDAVNMPDGPAKTARIQHIMDSLMTPGAGISRHTIGRVERMLGITPGG